MRDLRFRDGVLVGLLLGAVCGAGSPALAAKEQKKKLSAYVEVGTQAPGGSVTTEVIAEESAAGAFAVRDGNIWRVVGKEGQTLNFFTGVKVPSVASIKEIGNGTDPVEDDEPAVELEYLDGGIQRKSQRGGAKSGRDVNR